MWNGPRWYIVQDLLEEGELSCLVNTDLLYASSCACLYPTTLPGGYKAPYQSSFYARRRARACSKVSWRFLSSKHDPDVPRQLQSQLDYGTFRIKFSSIKSSTTFSSLSSSPEANFQQQQLDSPGPSTTLLESYRKSSCSLLNTSCSLLLTSVSFLSTSLFFLDTSCFFLNTSFFFLDTIVFFLNTSFSN